MIVAGGCPLCAAEPGPLMIVLDISDDVDDHRLGQWCPTCALPAAVAFPIHARCGHGWPQPIDIPDVVVCLDCGTTLVPLQPPVPVWQAGNGWPG